MPSQLNTHDIPQKIKKKKKLVEKLKEIDLGAGPPSPGPCRI